VIRLGAQNVYLGYHGVPVVTDLTLEVNEGELVLLAGPNGAGKTTTLMGLAGALRPMDGTVTADGAVTRLPLFRRVRGGLGLVTEARSVFMGLTVAENLRLGRGDPELAYGYFPELKPFHGKRAGLLSGGQQQMLSLGRVLAAAPSMILADELSFGLAPIVVGRLLSALRDFVAEGASVLLVEQHVHLALNVADRVYFLKQGRIQVSGSAEEFRDRQDRLVELYL
jgi:branched-chain amino acid transport system ATP-binding protein